MSLLSFLSVLTKSGPLGEWRRAKTEVSLKSGTNVSPLTCRVETGLNSCFCFRTSRRGTSKDERQEGEKRGERSAGTQQTRYTLIIISLNVCMYGARNSLSSGEHLSADTSPLVSASETIRNIKNVNVNTDQAVCDGKRSAEVSKELSGTC